MLAEIRPAYAEVVRRVDHDDEDPSVVATALGVSMTNSTSACTGQDVRFESGCRATAACPRSRRASNAHATSAAAAGTTRTVAPEAARQRTVACVNPPRRRPSRSTWPSSFTCRTFTWRATPRRNRAMVPGSHPPPRTGERTAATSAPSGRPLCARPRRSRPSPHTSRPSGRRGGRRPPRRLPGPTGAVRPRRARVRRSPGAFHRLARPLQSLAAPAAGLSRRRAGRRREVAFRVRAAERRTLLATPTTRG